MSTLEIITLILGSSGTTAILQSVLSKNETKAKTEAIIQEYYGSTIEDMHNQIDKLRAEICELNKTVDEYKQEETVWEEKRKGFINQINKLEKLNAKMNETIKKLTDDNNHYKEEQQKMSEEIEYLKKQVEQLNSPS